MNTSRREFMRQSAAAAAAAVANVALPAEAQNVITDADAAKLKWSKAPCRFCGVGCSVLVGTRDNRVFATKGDTESEVNRGLNCVKGYFLSKIMYGVDRLTTPLLRKRGDRYDNIECNARHCMATAVFGAMRTFGADEPMGCYDDIAPAPALNS